MWALVVIDRLSGRVMKRKVHELGDIAFQVTDSDGTVVAVVEHAVDGDDDGIGGKEPRLEAV